jgi:hypothetical protein
MKILFRKPDEFDYELQRKCLNCKTDFQGKYCPTCGEKVLEPGEKSIGEFLGGLLNAFTFLEGKFFRTFWLILSQPGQFSRFFSEGKRQPYMKPVSIFFVANFIYFLFPFITSNTFNTPLKYQVQMNVYGNVAQQMVDEKIKRDEITYNQLEQAYNSQSMNMAKMFIALIVALLALFFAAFNLKSKWYFADHLYLSFEFNTYFLFLNMILLSIIVSIIFVIANFFNWTLRFNDAFFTVVFAITSAWFFIRALRTYYSYSWWRTILTTCGLLICLRFVMDIYRGVLFFITMWTI